MSIYLSLFISLIGLIMFFACKTNGDLKTIGRDMFWVGLLAFLLTGGPQHVVSFLK